MRYLTLSYEKFEVSKIKAARVIHGIGGGQVKFL
jgi:hypothetical protein